MDRAGQTGNRLLRLAAWLSQGANLLLLNGSPDETISGRAYRQGELLGDARWRRARRVIDRVFFWAEEHCRQSHQQDMRFATAMLGAHGVPEYSTSGRAGRETIADL